MVPLSVSFFSCMLPWVAGARLAAIYWQSVMAPVDPSFAVGGNVVRFPGRWRRSSPAATPAGSQATRGELVYLRTSARRHAVL